MSYTEIYKFGKDGNCVFLDETKNSHRGAMAVWRHLEKKYLPPYVPSYLASMPESFRKERADWDYTRFSSSTDDELKEFWNLVDEDRVDMTDKIVLSSTYDNVVVMREDIPTLLEAYRAFGGDTSLKEQADIIEKFLMSDDDLIAIAWNQTSVNSSPWETWKPNAEEPTPYNLFKTKGKKHRVMWCRVPKKERVSRKK